MKQIFSSTDIKLSKIVGFLIIFLFIIAIIAYTYPLIGLFGQIKPAAYPESYSEADAFLQSQNITGHIIYLPWEAYLTYTWTLGTSPDGRIAVPINKLLTPIVQTSPGQWGAMDSIRRNITDCLSAQSVSCLENMGVQYVIKDRCAFYPLNYSFINSTPVHTDLCMDIYNLDSKIQIERSAEIPARFIIGSVISILTLAALTAWLIKKKK
jgi:hypothetical protein